MPRTDYRREALNGYRAEYERSRHYRPEDRVTELEVYTGFLDSPTMNLIVERGEETYRLPFYFDQEDQGDDARYIESRRWAWAYAMLGATEWSDWMDSADLERL
jgi:hypothetical protein